MTHPRSILLVVCAWMPLAGCHALETISQGVLSGDAAPSSIEIVSGLKQALAKGAGQAVADLAKAGGYLDDPRVRIPFPEQAEFVADALRTIGLSSLVQQFEDRLNRGAEAGAKQALGIFETAIGQMSFEDATGILMGDKHAATEYFRKKTTTELTKAFMPRIDAALSDVGATKVWSDVTSAYNKIPFTSAKIDTDIAHYATVRALDGLFLKLGEEEERIRQNPVARTTALLQKVFAYATRQTS